MSSLVLDTYLEKGRSERLIVALSPDSVPPEHQWEFNAINTNEAYVRIFHCGDSNPRPNTCADNLKIFLSHWTSSLWLNSDKVILSIYVIKNGSLWNKIFIGDCHSYGWRTKRRSWKQKTQKQIMKNQTKTKMIDMESKSPTIKKKKMLWISLP